MSNEPITVLIKYRTQPGKERLAMSALSALVEAVTSCEPECQGITIFQDSRDSSSFLLVEQWPDRATFVGPHMQQPHIQTFMKHAEDFLVGPPDISFLQPVTGA